MWQLRLIAATNTHTHTPLVCGVSLSRWQTLVLSKHPVNFSVSISVSVPFSVARISDMN